jgi:hypothetical protein
MSKNIKAFGTHQSRVGAATQMTGGSASLKMQLGANNIESNTDIKHLTTNNEELGIKSTKMNIADNRLNNLGVSNYINSSQLIGLGSGAHNKSQSIANTPSAVHIPSSSVRFGNSQISVKTNR